MGTKRVLGSAEQARRAEIERAAKMRAAKLAKAAARAARRGEASGAEAPNGTLQAVASELGNPGLLLLDALKSKSKLNSFAKQQLKEARGMVLDRLPAIVKALAEKSAESYLTAKFLFDFAEVEKISIKTGNPGRPSSLKAVLRKMSLEGKGRMQTSDAKIRQTSAKEVVSSEL